MYMFDLVCPLFCAGAGRMNMSKDPPHCISNCAWYDEVNMQCCVLTIAQNKDLSSETIDIEYEDEE